MTMENRLVRYNGEYIATVEDLINCLKRFPPETPIVLIKHEDDGHHIDYEHITEKELDLYVGNALDNDGLNISFQ